MNPFNLPPEIRIELAWDEEAPKDGPPQELIDRETALVRELWNKKSADALDGLPVDFVEKHIQAMGRRNARIRAGMPIYYWTMKSIEQRRAARGT